ncbi:hypothetical protein [Mycobacteroides abscessus]|uniref:hypothetical protein n=1 Tax=Mycobacteroides abscessus TaxID=36809 RepID=UPI0012FFD81C|nr:hypothetical protein [Mycobacteroides abscessus]
MTTVPDNPATALERIFDSVRSSGQKSIKGVWTTVLNAQHGTPEFYKRHSEVMALVSRLQLILESLPDDDSTRVRNLGDVPLWYGAVLPIAHWDDQNFKAWAALIPEHNIRLLGSLGEILSHRTTDAKLSNTDVSRLRASLEEWKKALGETELPEAIRLEVHRQVEHIEWLLSQVDRFGYEPVVQQSRTLFSMGFSVVKAAGKAGNIVTAMSSLFQFITHISVNNYGEAVNALTGMMSAASDLFTVASSEQQAIEGKREQKALTQADTSDGEAQSGVIDGEVIDGEVVDVSSETGSQE